MAAIFWFFLLLILYTYLGYPLIIAALARVWPKYPSFPPVEPTVTLLIAAYNEQDVIAGKLENSLAVEYPPEKLQILVAADGSDDRTPQIVEGFRSAGVELLYSPDRQGKMAAINRAIPFARGEIIVFSDANNYYSRETIRELVAPFADPTIGAVSGSKIILHGDGVLGESEGLYWKYEAFIKKMESRLGNCTGVSGEILALRRSLFKPPPEKIINDDFFMALQVIRDGYRVVYTPNARSTEHISPTAQDEITRRTRMIAGRYQAMALSRTILPWRSPLIVWQIVSHKFLRPLVPFAMIGAFCANLMLVFFPGKGTWNPYMELSYPYNWIWITLQFIFYGLARAGVFWERKSKIGKLLYLPYYLVNSNLAAMIGLYRFLSKRQTVHWQRVARRQ